MLALTGATIYPITSSVIKNGTVLIGKDGRIKKVGAKVKLPKGCQTINCKGLNIYPGFIEAHCHLGINREGLGAIGSHANEMTAPITPDMQAFDAVDVQDMHFKKALFEGGVTTANVSPGSGNIIGGTCDVITVKPARTAEELMVKPMIALKMAFGENPFRVYGSQKRSPATRMAIPALIRDQFTKVQNYIGRRKEAKKGKKHFDKDTKLEVLAKLLERKIPAHCHAHEAFDIMTSLRMAKEFGYRMVCVHGTGSATVAKELKKAKIPVILGPQGGFNGKIENRHRSLETARQLAEAGIEFSISTDHPVIPLRDIRIEAAKMVNRGLDPKIAIKALTAVPAKILGLEKEIGAIKPGMRANLIVWDGDPLDIANGKVRHSIVDGQLIERQTTEKGDFLEV